MHLNASFNWLGDFVRSVWNLDNVRGWSQLALLQTYGTDQTSSAPWAVSTERQLEISHHLAEKKYFVVMYQNSFSKKFRGQF